MATTKVRLNKSRGQIRNSENTVTGEAWDIQAPVVFYDEFQGSSLANWTETLVDTAGTALTVISGLAGSHGVAALYLDATDEAQEACLTWGDKASVLTDKGTIFECRLNMSVVDGAGTGFFVGLAGDYAADKATMQRIGFRFSGGVAPELLAQVADETVADLSEDTGITLDAAEWYVCRIDMRNLADIRFYVNGARVASATTFVLDEGNLGAGQPCLSVSKASGTAAPRLAVDYVKIWSAR